MDYINPDLIAVTAYNVCQQMQVDASAAPEWTEVALLIGTAAVESEFSIGAKGQRLGPFGVDINAVSALYESFKPYSILDHRRWTKDNNKQKTSWNIFSRAWLEVKNLPYIEISRHDMRHLIVHNVRFAASMCRWIYLNILVSKCENLPAIAEAWELLYKDIDDRTSEDFMRAWADNECATLMQVVGYN